jgi:hypothetical protein
MSKRGEVAQPLILNGTVNPIAVRPEEAARALGMSQSLFDRLVKEGSIDPPVSVPGSRRKVYCYQRLQDNFRAWRDLGEEDPSEWGKVTGL